MAVAAFAAGFNYTYPPDRKCRQDAKKGSQGADEPAVEAGNLKV
jgi:hypothetical protein